MAALRDASELLYPAVYATVMSLDIEREGKDAGIAKLALRIARVIDETTDPKQASALWHLGAELRTCLETLGATPAARAALAKGVKDKPAARENKLEKLRAVSIHKPA